MQGSLISMFALTGRPEKEQLQKAFDVLKQVGMDEIMLYARSGCELEYMSEEWLDTIDTAIKIAKQNKMGVWIYDDFNWPSGFLGGKITENPEFRLKSIETVGENAGEITVNENVNSNDYRRYFPDLFSADAVNCFIENTHEVYYKRFGEYFGSVIRGFFTDEPSIGHYCLGTRIPYYDGMDKDYKALCGRDFFTDIKSADDSFYKYAMRAVADRFSENYLLRISRWCEERGVLSTGHLMEENEPNQATRKNGDILKAIRSISLPAIDEVCSDFEKSNIFGLLGVAEYAAKGNGVMAELFALGPCDISYSKRRAMLYLMAAFKVNRYLHTLYHLDLRGNMGIKDYFNVCSPDQPDFEAVKLLKKEADIAAEYAAKDFTPDIYVQYPITYAQMKSPFEINTDKFCEVLKRLSFSGIQWKFITENEIKTDAPILYFTEGFNCIFSGREYDNAADLARAINENAVYTEGVFTRRFNDGSFIKINLNTYEITTENSVSYEVVGSEKPSFSVDYKNKNTIRAMFINEQTKAVIDSEIDTDVVFSVRRGEALKIGDSTPKLYDDSGVLSVGFRKLYSDTDPLPIGRGSTEIFSADDYKYMPSVFLSGDWKAQAQSGEICKLRLTPRQRSYNTGEYIEDFGCVEFSAKVNVPKGATALSLGGTKLYTKVYVNDELVSAAAFSPYVFDLGGKTGEIELKIVQYSSISALFGDIEYFEKVSDKISWHGTPSPDKTLFGFTEFNWVK